MFRTLLVVFVAPAVHSIIVTDPPPTGNEYKYSYKIEDPSTGDSKSMHEVRHGDVVSGAYTVLDPDGTKRTVQYTADPKHGFNAVVSREPAMDTISANPQTPQQYSANDYPGYEYQSATSEEYATIPSHRVNFQPYYSNSYIEDKPMYFTPANEIKSDDLSFQTGVYFVPSNRHH